MHRVDVETGDVIALTPGPGVQKLPAAALRPLSRRTARLAQSARQALLRRLPHQRGDRREHAAGSERSLQRHVHRSAVQGAAWPAATRRRRLATTCDLQRNARRMGAVLAGSTSRTRCRRGRSSSATTARSSTGSTRAGATRRRSSRRTWRAAFARARRRRAGRFSASRSRRRSACVPLAASSSYAASELARAGCGLRGRFRAIAKLADGDALVRQPSDDLRNWLVYVERDAARRAAFSTTIVPKNGAHAVRHPAGACRRRRWCRCSRSWSRRATARSRLLPVAPARCTRPDTPTPMVLLVHGGPWARDIWALYSDAPMARQPRLRGAERQLPRLHRLRQGVRQRRQPRVGRQDARRPDRRGRLGDRAEESPNRTRSPSTARATAATRRWSARPSRRTNSPAPSTCSASPT